MPTYTRYRRFLSEAGLQDCLHHFKVWCDEYYELVLADDDGEE